MIKKTVKYENFDGQTVTEEFFFHLNKAELIELEMSREGGLAASLQRIIDSEDTAKLVKEFKHLLLLAYGTKSADGKSFLKSDALREAFATTEAFGEIFVELATDTDAALEFINGIVPTNLERDMAKLAKKQKRQQEAAATE